MTAAFYILMANYLFHAKERVGKKGIFMPMKPEPKAGSLAPEIACEVSVCYVSLSKNLGPGFPFMDLLGPGFPSMELLCFPLKLLWSAGRTSCSPKQ